LATTTPAAVITAIETLIEGLTPSGDVIQGMEKKYKATSDRLSHTPWEARQAGDIDRKFQISEFEIETMEMFGNTAEQAINASLVIEVGHMTGNFRESRNRRLLDVYQIASQLTWPPNHDAISGLHAIFPTVAVAITPIQDGKFVVSTMGFTARLMIDANYGGS
jgi:hypothetical protein